MVSIFCLWAHVPILLALTGSSWAARSRLLPRQANVTTQDTCTENREKYSLIPTDVVAANPKCSSDRRTCYISVPNDQLQRDGQYRALPGTEYPTVAIGPAGDDSNSYADAYEVCSNICTSKGKDCKSFNILTTSEGEVNDCKPTWVCRYSPNAFDVNDYTQGGLGYSQAYNVYAKCDYGDSDKECTFPWFHQAWAQCSVLGPDVEFKAHLIIAAQMDGYTSASSEVGSRKSTVCLLPGASSWSATIEYPFTDDWCAGLRSEC